TFSKQTWYVQLIVLVYDLSQKTLYDAQRNHHRQDPNVTAFLNNVQFPREPGIFQPRLGIVPRWTPSRVCTVESSYKVLKKRSEVKAPDEMNVIVTMYQV